MTIRTPLVIGSAGLVQQLQPGDTIGAPTTAPSLRSITNGETSVALAIGMPVYTSAADTVKRGQANALTTARIAGLIYDVTIAAAATGNLCESGTIVATTTQWDAAVTGETGGLTFGTDYFVDPANPGKLTAAAPTTPGQVNTYIGYAISTTELVVAIGRPILL